MWLRAPDPLKNEWGLAVECRRCRDCPRIKDVTSWLEAGEDIFGQVIPTNIGPLAAKRMHEIAGRRDV